MFNENQQKNNVGHAYKCGGIPHYPAKHSLFKKFIEDASEEDIKIAEEDAIKFLNKYDFDLLIDED